MDEAKAMGAIALFGEKYGERVRVIKFGDSVELCGGCHANATGQIGLFKIVSESAVAAGIRRIEAVSGISALERVKAEEDTIKEIRGLFNNAPNILSAINRLIADNANYKKMAEEDEKKRANHLAHELADNAENYNGIRLVRYTESKRNPVLVRAIAGIIQKEVENTVFAAAFEFEGKPQLILAYTNDLVASGRNAGADIRDAAKCIQGGGGGQPGLATAGGRDSSGLQAALDTMVSKL